MGFRETNQRRGTAGTSISGTERATSGRSFGGRKSPFDDFSSREE